MVQKKTELEELVSDPVGIFLKQQCSAVTVIPFQEPQLIPVDSSENITHPSSIVDAPMFNQQGWNCGYTRGEKIGEKTIVQYYRYKVGVYNPPGN